MSAQGSGSFEEEEPFVSPRDAEMLHVFKAAMSKLAKSSSSADNFSPFDISPKDIMGKYNWTRSQKSQEKAI